MPRPRRETWIITWDDRRRKAAVVPLLDGREYAVLSGGLAILPAAFVEEAPGGLLTDIDSERGMARLLKAINDPPYDPPLTGGS